MSPPIIARVVPDIAAMFGDIYPEVAREAELIKTVATDEESRFERHPRRRRGAHRDHPRARPQGRLQSRPGEEISSSTTPTASPPTWWRNWPRRRGSGGPGGVPAPPGRAKAPLQSGAQVRRRVEEVHEALRREFTPEFVGYGPMEHAAKAVALVKDGSRVDALAVGRRASWSPTSPLSTPRAAARWGHRTVTFEGGARRCSTPRSPYRGLSSTKSRWRPVR